jgi:penicillin-binding protein 1C
MQFFHSPVFASKRFRILAALIGGGLLLFFCIPMPTFQPDYGTLVLDADGEILHGFLNRRQQWCLPPDPDDPVPEKLRAAVLEFEDRYFYRHPGVNPVSVARALLRNTVSGSIRSGASTITMQVARLSRPKPRTVPNKIVEALGAFKLELTHSKRFILRAYLDHAPYGRNVIGVRAASLRYFGKEPDRLSWAEAACLAVLPNHPGLVAPGVRTNLLREKRNTLLRRLCRRGRLTPAALELALLEPAPAGSIPFPASAMHLSCSIAARPECRGRAVRTTIRREIQARIEALVAEHAAERLAPLGIRNAAALVVETASGRVAAYVGSQDFFDDVRSGQVDGVTAPRSPGSLLKPLLYGLAMDRGVLLPQTRLRDVPTFYGAFSPANASETYDGLVTAREALVRSLNVPAVRVLYTVGVPPFYAFLKAAGMRTLFRSPDEYGLPLILGGAEVTAWDMAVLFRGLGSAGRFRPLSVLEPGPESSPEPAAPRLLSPGACWLVLNALRELKRPGAEHYWELFENQRPIAWKTGTSYGFRDAWAAGVSPQWTIVVWTGNFTGEGNANLSGASSAGTLLFAIHNALPRQPGAASWFETPVQDLEPAVLCAETGYLAGPSCGNRQTVEAPRGMHPLPVCPFHRRLQLTLDGRFEVCSACWTPNRHKESDRLVLPVDVVQFLRENGTAVPDAPRHLPSCPAHVAEERIALLYPQNRARLWIPRDLGGMFEKVTFRAAHLDRDVRVFWYLDDKYMGQTRNRHVRTCALAGGPHRLDVIDEYGNRASAEFSAETRETVP